MGRGVRRIYVEDEVGDHPRTGSILARFPRAEVVPCRRWGEVFNRRRQDFRLQKRRPALILARKHRGWVLPVPDGYGVGGERNYYFSHMLNCVYDCRYCFLQGMFRSAHYVVFVNYEDFGRSIDRRLAEDGRDAVWFFSGYDCDSLAFEPVTGFAEAFLPFFASRPRARLELRTKSARVEPLLERRAPANCVVAFSFTPDEVHRRLERGVPTVGRRLEAMSRLAERGWKLGLRFDPLIWSRDFAARYRRLFDRVFAAVPRRAIHSVSFGVFRLPRVFHRRMLRLHPDEPLFAMPLDEAGGQVTFRAALERQMLEFCRRELARRLPAETLFPCGGEAQRPAVSYPVSST